MKDIETRDLNIFDYGVLTLISSGISYFLYKILYPIVGYNNLKDFYIGTSIYQNHNKALDIFIVFAYLIIFFAILPIYKMATKKLPEIEFNWSLPDFSITNFLEKHKITFFILEIMLSFGYIFLHPFNGQIYIPVCALIVSLIAFSIFHSYKNLFLNKEVRLSIFALIPIFILLFGQGYNTGNAVGIDNHHTGEQLTLFWEHQAFNLKYYKDIILVHGFLDVIAATFGSMFFGETTVYSYLLGRSLFDNTIVILNSVIAYYIFFKCPIFVSFSLFRAFNIPQLYILSFFLFLKKSLQKYPALWICLYLITSFSLLFFWTTYGTFWVLASLPLTIYILGKKDKNWLIFVILLALIGFFNKEFIYYYSIEATNYIQSNLYNFGNNFPTLKLHQIFSNFIKLFAIAILPYFVIKLIEEFKKSDRNIEYIFTLIFAIIFSLTSLNYGLGRIDNIAMQRIRDISMTYLGVIIPYLLVLNRSKYLVLFKYISVIFFAIIAISALPKLNRWLPETHLQSNTLLPTIGNLQLDKQYQENLEDIKAVVDKYSKTNDDFLDLNYGINYFYFNKKMPIPYVSYYNIVNSRQNKRCAELLNKNLPNIVVIESDLHTQFDNVYPAQKINAIYKLLLKSSKYSTLKTKHHTFLIKKSGELNNLDEILSTNNLEYMPDTYENSINSLPLEKIEQPYSITENKIISKFTDVDFVEIEIESNNQEFEVYINNSNSILSFKSRQNKVLIPIDNFPSWLLDKNKKEISILSNNALKIKSVNFYKRN